MKGFKVVNYDVWKSLPEIFNTVKEADEKSKNWEWVDGAVIEEVNSNKRSRNIVKYLKGE
jgi:hypothetical protein